MPFPLRFSLAFDGALLGQVLRIFTDTVARWYRKRHLARGYSPSSWPQPPRVPPPPALQASANLSAWCSTPTSGLSARALCAGRATGSTYKPPPASLPTTNPAASACADTSCAHASLLANDRLSILDDGNVRLEFKRPWSDGTSFVEMPPLALIARLAALVPSPRRHTVPYCGVLSSHASSRNKVVLVAPEAAPPDVGQDKPKSKPKYIRWSDLLRRVFAVETVCQKCRTPLRLISLIKSEAIARRILVAMHLPADVPELHPARPPPGRDGEAREGEDSVN
jgi:hypothetical protein